jgi:hypothetical protein
MKKYLFSIFFAGIVALFAFSLLTTTAVAAEDCNDERGDLCGFNIRTYQDYGDCCSPLICVNMRCCDPRESLGEGEECYCDEECASGRCTDGKCEVLTEDCNDRGEPCGKNIRTGQFYGDCCSPLICEAFKCCDSSLSLGEGETCYSDEECASGRCTDGKCEVLGDIPFCGNAKIDEGEECDSSNLNGKNCTDFGFGGGTLKCTNCTFDTSGCTTGGNGGNGGGGFGPFGVIGIENPLKAEKFEDIINNVIDFIFNIAIVISPLMIIYAAFLFVTSAGSIDQVNQAKKVIIYTLTGFAVILLAKGFIGIIKELLGT